MKRDPVDGMTTTEALEYDLHTRGARHSFEPKWDGRDPERNKPYATKDTAIMTTNNVPTLEQIADIVRDHLTAAYVCNRAWEAWNVGTMSRDDFIEASETEMADEIAAAVIEHFGQPAMPADEWLSELAHLLGRYGMPPEHLEVVIAHAQSRIEGES